MDRNTNYKEHSIFLSEIAQNLLRDNFNVLSIYGVKEIISLYLLIPYITKEQLDAGMLSKIPQLNLSDEFVNGINLENLRNAICHSFVSVEDSYDDKNLGRLILDDRTIFDRKTHDKQIIKSKGVFINIIEANKKLFELHTNIINSIK